MNINFTREQWEAYCKAEALGDSDAQKAIVAQAQKPDRDLVEVVRCKDCKYCEDDYPLNTYWCPWLNTVREEDYCSKGERR